MALPNQFGALMDFTGRIDRVNEFMLGMIDACYKHGVLVNGVVWEVDQYDESAPILTPSEGESDDVVQRIEAFNQDVRLLCLRNRFQLDAIYDTLSKVPDRLVSLVHLCFIEPSEE